MAVASIVVNYRLGQSPFNASLKDCLAGVSGFKRIRCPSHDSRRRSVIMLQGSHFVTSSDVLFSFMVLMVIIFRRCINNEIIIMKAFIMRRVSG